LNYPEGWAVAERMSILEFGQRCQKLWEHLMGERFPRIDGATAGSPKHSSSTTMETTSSSSSIHTAMPTLKGKRVFITGGTTGIGRFSDQKAQKFSPAVGIKRN
jgi:hypothetical protein